MSVEKSIKDRIKEKKCKNILWSTAMQAIKQENPYHINLNICVIHSVREKKKNSNE